MVKAIENVKIEEATELSFNLLIKCELEKESEICLIRPENTNPCGEEFNVEESEIFCNPISYNPIIYSDKYYQLCPHCGYIVTIPKEKLSHNARKRIEIRNKQDRKLFRKMYLYSELFSLDKTSTDDQKRLLKNK